MPSAGGGYFHYAGDFNDQQINFYQYANAFVKQGGTFSWATDLGSGFVNSYSFYLLGSPFFWLTLLVPARFMPWVMVPLLCLKIALAGGGVLPLGAPLGADGRLVDAGRLPVCLLRVHGLQHLLQPLFGRCGAVSIPAGGAG